MDETSGATVRFIKVGRTTQVRRGGNTSVMVPFIRLSGKWLERAGFIESDMIAVTAGDGVISLRRLEEQSTSASAQGELF
jgi:hypothetical protein